MNKTVKIHFPLSSYIPIETNSTYFLDLHPDATYKFKFKTLYENATNSESAKKCTTIIIEVTHQSLNENISLHELMLHSVTKSITTINNYLDALRLDSNWNFVLNFSISDLPEYIQIEVDGNKYRYVTQPTKLIQLSDLTSDFVVNVGSSALKRVSIWWENPEFEVIDKFLSKGIHHLYTEEFTFAIVELQTSFETYIRLCQRIILTKKGKTEDEIQNAMTISFRNTIEDHIAPALDENFRFNENPVIKEWYEKLYSLRNKIVHSGKSYISGDSAYEAFDALQKVTNYITELMVDKEFMAENGKIVIADLNKNTPSDIDRQKIDNALKQQGIIKEIED